VSGCARETKHRGVASLLHGIRNTSQLPAGGVNKGWQDPNQKEGRPLPGTSSKKRSPSTTVGLTVPITGTRISLTNKSRSS